MAPKKMLKKNIEHIGGTAGAPNPTKKMLSKKKTTTSTSYTPMMSAPTETRTIDMLKDVLRTRGLDYKTSMLKAYYLDLVTRSDEPEPEHDDDQDSEEAEKELEEVFGIDGDHFRPRRSAPPALGSADMTSAPPAPGSGTSTPAPGAASYQLAALLDHDIVKMLMTRNEEMAQEMAKLKITKQNGTNKKIW